jgi:hypothetical protein
MPNYDKYTLAGKQPWQTWTQLVEYVTESSSFTDGSGNVLTQSINLTASNAISSSYTITSSFDFISVMSITSSFATQSISASYLSGSATGSFTGSYTGSFYGTASWVINAISSSYLSGSSTGSFMGSFTGSCVGTSSWANNAITASQGAFAWASMVTSLTSSAISKSYNCYLSRSSTGMYCIGFNNPAASIYYAAIFNGWSGSSSSSVTASFGVPFNMNPEGFTMSTVLLTASNAIADFVSGSLVVFSY